MSVISKFITWFTLSQETSGAKSNFFKLSLWNPLFRIHLVHRIASCRADHTCDHTWQQRGSIKTQEHVHESKNTTVTSFWGKSQLSVFYYDKSQQERPWKSISSEKWCCSSTKELVKYSEFDSWGFFPMCSKVSQLPTIKRPRHEERQAHSFKRQKKKIVRKRYVLH